MLSTRMRRFAVLGITTAVGASLLLVSPAQAAPGDVVVINDPGLARCLTGVTGGTTGALTEGQLAAITTIDCGSLLYPVSSLEGIQKAPNLTSITIRDQNVSDLSPLAALPNLSSLTLSGNQITDLQPLTGLASLGVLDVSNNNLSVVPSFARSGKLARVDVSGNHLLDVSGFSGVFAGGVKAASQKVTLPSVELNTPSPLTLLDADGSVPTPTAVAAGVTFVQGTITYTDPALVGTTQVTEFVPSSTSGTLSVSVTQNVVRNLGAPVTIADKALQSCVATELSGGPITEVTLTDITSLACPAGSLTSLEGVEKMVNLQSLAVAENTIVDLSPVTGLPLLAEVNVGENAVTDLSPLGTLPALTTADVSGNKVSDVSALAGAAKLAVLDVSDNRVADLSALAPLSAAVLATNQSIQLSDAVVGTPFAFRLLDSRRAVPGISALATGATYDGKSLLYGLNSLVGAQSFNFTDPSGSFTGRVQQNVVAAQLTDAPQSQLVRVQPTKATAIRSLASTGASEASVLLAVGAGALLAGAAVVVAARRRRV
ncbi:hypothetical protein GCM10022198_16280 [Klugiella xanthotipulae]|uniref:LPXTG-motif cell wall-anchored protein n=1 Tax=Klugiella xanthotipulae TaxID=244735 RepID=A0A543HH54_9MICO|nr:leucine-rich repeat domain-containing protein [Klugiella xanthotipulae]TQM57664.1 LPXTG-motif cell wall-anchored protein [Klugiella xanthotipulae]